jgi:multicomponent Na+:H+ antiporter subunit D
MALGAASIVYGALQAISRRDTSEVMAYSAIGQVGYILVALGVGGTVGFTAAVLYSVVNSLNKGLVFLAAGIRGPLVGAAFAVGAFSIAGVPPAAGFVAKISVFKAAIAEGALSTSVALVALIFVGGAMSFLYSFQVYQRRFLAPRDEGKPSPAATRALVAGLAALVLLLGLWPEPLVYLSEAAAGVLAGGG